MTPTTKAKSAKKPRKRSNKAAKSRARTAKPRTSKAKAEEVSKPEPEPEPVLDVDREIAPEEQDRPDDFFLGGEWALCVLPPKALKGQVWTMKESAPDAEALFAKWHELRRSPAFVPTTRLLRFGDGDPVQVAILRGPDMCGPEVHYDVQVDLVAMDPEGRVVRDMFNTNQIARLTKRWSVEIHTGATKSPLHVGTYKECQEVYGSSQKSVRAGTLVWLTPLGEVYKQRAKTQFRDVLDVDKLSVNEDALARHNKTVDRDKTIVGRVRTKLAYFASRLARRLSP